MGILDFFKKKETGANAVIASYSRFYEANHSQPLSFYGLIPPGSAGRSPLHDDNPDIAAEQEFSFDAACVWEDFSDETKIEKTIRSVRNGNIPIANEGCGTYWILITTGKHAGEVWLLTESGVTPVAINLTLEAWKEKQLGSNNTCWYPAVSKWGPFENAFFYAHAPKKMVTAKQYVFGVTTHMCSDCLNFISKAAAVEKQEIIVTDHVGTRIFEVNGNVEVVK